MVRTAWDPSDTQSAMLLSSFAVEETTAYWLRAHWLMAAEIDEVRWHRAWFDLCSNVALLRTAWDSGTQQFVEVEPIQAIKQTIDASTLDEFVLRTQESFKRQWAPRNTDVTQEVRLVQAGLYRWKQTGLMLWAWVCHHSLMDGNAFVDCVKLLVESYKKDLATQPTPPHCNSAGSSLEDPSRRHFAWHKTLRGARYEDSHSFFRAMRSNRGLRGGVLDLLRDAPTGLADAPTLRHAIDGVDFAHSPAAQTGIPASAWIHASVGLVLRRISGARTIAIAATRHLRRNARLDLPPGALGLFANTLPFGIDHDDDSKVIEHVDRIRRNWIALRAHEHVPYSVGLKALREEDASLAIDCVVDIAYRTRAQELAMHLDGLCTGSPVFAQATDFPLALSATLEPSLEMTWVADPQRVSSCFLQDVAAIHKETFEALIASPDATLRDVYTSLADVRSSPATTRRSSESPSHVGDQDPRNVVARLARIVSQMPDALALSDASGDWTYRQFWERASAIAQRVLRECPSDQSIVPILGKRSVETLLALWGVLRSGKAFFLLDEDTPPERQRVILEKLTEHAGMTPWLLRVSRDENEDRNGLSASSLSLVQETLAEIRPDGLAYLVATSGTTGVPKLVMIEHHSLDYLVSGYQAIAQLVPTDVRYQAASVASDTFVLEATLYLCHGCRLWIEPDLLSHGFETLNQRIETVPITVLGLPSSVWREWAIHCLEDLERTSKRIESLRMVICSMERTDSELLHNWRQTQLGHKIWLNAYGPSETACVATILRLEPDAPTPQGNIPIGRCLDGASVQIWNEEGVNVPAGVLGEIVIGGEGVGRGYLGDASLASHRFKTIPSRRGGRSDVAQERVYCTGDLGYIDRDGHAVFVGRKDSQIKIRGHRIELEEVEFHMKSTLPDVEDAAVVAVPRPGGTSELVAYYCARREITLAQWLDSLRDHLIAVATPRHFHRIEAIPRSPVGKVERQKLIERHAHFMSGESPQRDARGADFPATMFATYLRGVLEEFLPNATLDPRQGFVDLGGDSLLAMRLLARIERDTAVRLPPATFVGNMPFSTICELWSDPQRSAVQVVPLTDGPGLPLFWMPDLSGDAYAIPDWITQWRGRRPVFAVGVSPEAFVPKGVTMQSLASAIVAAIREIARDRPIHLLGLSFGGKLAWEVAYRMQESGLPVGYVIVGDASGRPRDRRLSVGLALKIARHLPMRLIHEWRANRGRFTSHWLKKSWKQTVTRAWKRLQLALTRKTEHASQHVAMHFEVKLRSDAQLRFMEQAWVAATCYRAVPSPLPLLLLRCRVRPLTGDYAPDLGWSEAVLGRLKIESLDTDHTGLFQPVWAQPIVAAIERELKVEDRALGKLDCISASEKTTAARSAS